MRRYFASKPPERLAKTQEPWDLKKAFEFLESVEADDNDKRRYSAQFGLLDHLEGGRMSVDDQLRAIKILKKGLVNKKLASGVCGRIQNNRFLKEEIYPRNPRPRRGS